MQLPLLKSYAISLISTPYSWGGDDPMSGFDCSGLACELLRASGLAPYQFRTNAQGIFEHLMKHGGKVQTELGAFAFYGESVLKISHVGFCLDTISMIEAGGGGSKTVNEKAASETNAFVRIRPILYRKDFLTAIMPQYLG